MIHIVCTVKKEWAREFLAKNFTKTFIKNWSEKRKIILYAREQAYLHLLADELIRYKRIKFLNELIANKLENEKNRLRNPGIYIHTDESDDEYNHILNETAKDAEAPKPRLLTKCPTDNCRGFLNSKSICGSCEKHICRKCMKAKLEEHECNQADIDNVKSIHKDSKPCPKCATRISKVSGCDQMWCLFCNTAFSWRTCKIEKELFIIHIIMNLETFR